MPTRNNIENFTLVAVILLSVVTLLLATLSPGFSVDNTLVYQGF